MTQEIVDPPAEFIHEVRNALDHLYDYAYLLRHPLAHKLVADPRLDEISRAQQVRRTLLHCIEGLQPQAQVGSEATRTYAVLMYRSVDGLAMPAIAAKLAISERQAYREYTKGIEAVARILWATVRAQAGEAAPAVATPRITHHASRPHPSPSAYDPSPDLAADRLALARAEAGRLQEKVLVELLAPTEVLHSVCTLLAPRIQHTGTQIVVAAPQPCPSVRADRTMLRQALLSLLSHALDTVAEQSTVTVAIEGGEEVQITVSGQLDRLRPVTVPTSRQGIGLAVAQMLLEAQGGALRVDTGSDVWQSQLRLPAAQPITILVVDDNASIGALFQRYLAGHKVATISAVDGPQALVLAVELQPQLIFLDLMLPHHDGWEILQELQQRPATRAIPVVVCSVLNEKDLALAMGASDYLTKPVSQTALLEVLRHWLGRLHPPG